MPEGKKIKQTSSVTTLKISLQYLQAYSFKQLLSNMEKRKNN